MQSLVKILHLSDSHLVSPGDLTHGHDPLARLRSAIDDINQFHSDAKFLVITGDLSDTGGEDSYLALQQVLGSLNIPYLLLMGNHDHRESFKSVFPHAADENGFIQASVNLGDLRLICLDTLYDGQVTGRLCTVRLNWLKQQLDMSTDQEVQNAQVVTALHNLQIINVTMLAPFKTPLEMAPENH